MENNNQNYEAETNDGISFSEIFYLAKKNIVMILILVVLFTAGGFCFGKFVKKPVYSATSSAIVQVDATNGSSEYNSFIYAQYLVNSISEFIKSDAVTKEVAKVLIDEEYEITHNKKDDNVEHFSKTLNKVLTEDEYEVLLVKKTKVIKNGTKIKTSKESLILDITYSAEKTSEKTPDEVVRISSLLIQKAKEVALTTKDENTKYTFPMEESINSIKYAYKEAYDLKEVKDLEGNVIKYTGVKNDEEITFTVSQYQESVEKDAAILRENFVIYHNGKELVMAIKNNEHSAKLDPRVASNALVYLTKYAREHKQDLDISEKNYLYPTFANKLIEMNTNSPFAVKSTKTLTYTAISLLLGIVVSFAIILIRYLMNDTFTSKSDLEKLTGKSILAYIEKFDEKETK